MFQESLVQDRTKQFSQAAGDTDTSVIFRVITPARFILHYIWQRGCLTSRKEYQRFQLRKILRLLRQHLQHKHCQHKLFNGGRLDWRTSECRHLSLTRTPMKLVVDGRSGKTSCSLDSDIFVSRALRIVSMLFTFTEENKYGNWSNHLKTFLHRHPPRV